MNRQVHCWTGRLEHAEAVHGWGSDEYWKAYDLPSATCMLPDGHAGPHEFMDDSNITVRFADKEQP